MVRAKTHSDVKPGPVEQIPPVKLDPELPHFVFKSKFKEDKVTLVKGVKERLPDGSARITPGVLAEFNHYTWKTDDVKLAKILRDGIAARLLHGIPLHVFETTTIKE